MEVCLIFPHQLFKNHPALDAERKIFLIEEWLFFKQFNFHKQKLILHRASMQFYKDWLQHKGYTVEYISCTSDNCDIRKLLQYLVTKTISKIHYADVTDDWLRRRLVSSAKKHSIEVTEYPTPYFLNQPEEIQTYFDGKKSYFQTDFYIQQRKQRNILVNSNHQPEGGKWTYDTENRARFPKHEVIPVYHYPKENDYIIEARRFVTHHFNDNYGNGDSPFPKGNGGFPCTYEEAEKWLEDFIKHRFEKFGVYEDAIVAGQSFLYHSVLSPLLNIGLLTPQLVIDKMLKEAVKYNVPLNSLEGFIRQIMGWREFIHIVYEREGSKQRTRNFWGFTRKIPSSFWNGSTGILPIDTTINKVVEKGYCHHIERLMILGNFMLLCEFNPDDVYRWFMEMFIDAYDWVMVPNVYGMTQFADGGIMVTKPYISSSNYILKMSDFKKGDWCEIWDALFWRFMIVHRNYIEKSSRLAMLLKTLDKMPKTKQEYYMEVAEVFLDKLS